MSDQLQKIMNDGYNPHKQLLDQTRKLVHKWEPTGLLEGLDGENDISIDSISYFRWCFCIHFLYERDTFSFPKDNGSHQGLWPYKTFWLLTLKHTNKIPGALQTTYVRGNNNGKYVNYLEENLLVHSPRWSSFVMKT